MLVHTTSFLNIAERGTKSKSIMGWYTPAKHQETLSSSALMCRTDPESPYSPYQGEGSVLEGMGSFMEFPSEL
jgi:hypothetical protein